MGNREMHCQFIGDIILEVDSANIVSITSAIYEILERRAMT